jgi:tetratricopeptide (TPR) repeat protein
MKMPQKKLIIFGVIIIVVAGISVAAAILFSQYQASIQPKEVKKPEVTAIKPQTKQKADDAVKKAYEGDVAGGAAELDKAAEGTSDKTEKYIIYAHKATLLFNSQDIPGALAAALKAHEYGNTSNSAALVARYSKAAGNNAQAVEYYKKAIELIDKTKPLADEDAKYYNNLIKEIEAGGTNG